MSTLRAQLDKLRRDLEPKEPPRYCVHLSDGTPLAECRCQPDSPKIRLRWPEEREG
jgi:hypothetical protein